MEEKKIDHQEQIEKKVKLETETKNIIITGTNKGIGYELIKQLCEYQQQNKTKYNLIMTSRNEEKGKTAYNQIIKKFPDLKDSIYYQILDVTKKESINNFYNWFETEFDKLDILVNNAGMGLYEEAWVSRAFEKPETTNEILDCNFYGAVNVSEKMLPLLRDNGKIIIVSSGDGLLSNQREKGKKLLSNPKMTKEKLFSIVEKFRGLCSSKEVIDQGFSKSSYIFSKAAINAYTRFILSKQMKNNQLAMNVDPGWCRTDMGSSVAPYPVSEGPGMIKFLMFDIPFWKNEKYNGAFWLHGDKDNPSYF